VLPPDEIRQLLAEKGIVGMGGATFPTHVKYAPQSSGRIIDTVILNGIECEPFITADYRILIEHADEVIRGLKYFLKASLANKGIIAIEDNKPRAIELFNQLTADDPNISVVVCPEKYPQGSERHLIYAVTGRVVPERALPSAVGVIVDNVATAMQAALAVKDDLPCYERIVTVSGNAVHKPGNYRVRIGTLYSHLVEQGAQGLKNDPARIISGGPMMGFSLHSLDFPVLKGTGGLLLFDHQSELAKLPPENPCVRCGKCVDTCPMFLEPTQLFKAVKRRDWPAALAGHVGTCIECGSCAYNCPAHIPLVQYIRMGKQFILTDGFGGHNPYYKK
ncbi:electron transport complex subunit RsxC, partial [Phascolarctobacterium faecium]